MIKDKCKILPLQRITDVTELLTKPSIIQTVFLFVSHKKFAQ